MVEAPSDLVVRSSPGRRGRSDDPPPVAARRAVRLPPLTLVAHRLVADRAMLAAVLVMTVVATTLVATIPVYNAAVADAGLRASLARATPTERTFVVATRTSADAWSEARDTAAAAMERLTALGADTVALAVTDSYQFGDGVAGERAVTALAALDQPGDLLTVVGGTGLPAGRSADGGPMAVALHTDAAAELGVGVGDRLVLSGGNADVEISIDALFAPADPGDPRWLDQPTVRDGVVEGESFVEVGPFLVSPADLERLDRRIRFEWRTAPDPAAVGTDDLDRLRAAVGTTERLVAEEMGGFDARTTTELGTFLTDTEDRLLSTTTAISAVLLQLVAAALVGLLLAAGVLASARAAETLLSWSRGASPAQVVASAVVEMLVLAAAATVAGPFLAREVVRLVDRSGVVAVAGLELRPEVVPAAFVVAGVVAALAVVIVAWPVVRSATAHRRRSSDHHVESSAWFQRYGIDIAIMVLAVGALWQMGSATDTVGADGIDPNLVVAPGLGVLAASLLALRLIRTGAHLAERRAPRDKGLVRAMAAWNLARHPARVVRPALLTVIALATAVFAATYAASWEQSRRDQADAAVGFDVRATPDARADDRIDPAELLPEYRGVVGVDGAAPYERVRATLGREEATLVAFDAERIEMVRARDDLTAVTGGSIDDLTVDEPPMPTIPLAGDGPQILLTVSVGWLPPQVISPGAQDAAGEDPTVELAATVVDADGTIQRTEPAVVELGEDREVALAFSARGAPVAAPLRLLELSVTAPVALVDPGLLPVPEGSTGDGTAPGVRPDQLTQQFEVEVTSITAGGADGAPGAGWVSARTVADRMQVFEQSARVRSEPGAVRLAFDTGLAVEASSPEATAVLLPAPAEAPAAPLPVLVTPDLRDAAQVDIGDQIVVRAAGTEISARVAGVIGAIPGAVDEARGVLADRSALVRHKWLTDFSSSEPTEVVASTDRDMIGAVRGALAAPPISSRAVTDRWAAAEDRSQDPTTIGIVGGLVTGVGAALVMSILGLVLTAVVNVRQRTAEFAVLRALGQTRRELRRSLLSEVVPVTVLSTLVGVGAGVALAWRSLSSLTAAGDGTVSVPEPVLVVPWAVAAVAAAAVAGVAITLPLLVAGALGRGTVAEELRIGAPA